MQNLLQSVYHSTKPLQKDTHFHDCHQIILVVKGSVDFCINDKVIRADAGKIAIFSRYENHSVCGSSTGYERYVLHIDPDIVNRDSIVYSLLTDRPVGFCNIIDVADCLDDIKEVFRRIIVEQNEGKRLADEMLQLSVKQLLIMIYRCLSEDFISIRDDVVINVKRQFENDYAAQYSLESLARRYSISASALSHRFRAVTGVSVMGYLQSCRIAAAKGMLADTDSDIGQIVEDCGFSDNSNFSRTFKQIVGITPSEFRKNFK